VSKTLTPELLSAPLVLEGRVMPASNATFLGRAGEVQVVYKPVAGEKPLWDFPDGTLANRELAAYAVSQALGWDVVPLTFLRDGPHGPGMVQVWQEPDPEQFPVDLVAPYDVPTGWKHVLDASDGRGAPVSLIHEDSTALRRMALFDVVVNNADRKGGHVLAMTGGHRYGVDHGISFHTDDKLRTVLWGWAGESLGPPEEEALGRLLADDTLAATLAELVTRNELRAFHRRCDLMLSRGCFPQVSSEWPAIPWPAF
jgi:uncharacterized repeat protein (TIGR03843 family)